MTFPFSMFGGLNPNSYLRHHQDVTQSHFIGQNGIIETSVVHTSKPVEKDGQNSSSESNKKEVINLDEFSAPEEQSNNDSVAAQKTAGQLKETSNTNFKPNKSEPNLNIVAEPPTIEQDE